MQDCDGGLVLELEETDLAVAGLMSALIVTALNLALTWPSPQESILIHNRDRYASTRAVDQFFPYSYRKLPVEDLLLRMEELFLSD